MERSTLTSSLCPAGMALEPRSFFLVSLTAVTFEDGRRWQAPEDETERARTEATRLATLAARQ